MPPLPTHMRGRLCRLNACGRATVKNHAHREGVIWGENRAKTSWKIKFPDLKELVGLHKSFVELLPLEGEMDDQEIRMRFQDIRNTAERAMTDEGMPEYARRCAVFALELLEQFFLDVHWLANK